MTFCLEISASFSQSPFLEPHTRAPVVGAGTLGSSLLRGCWALLSVVNGGVGPAVKTTVFLWSWGSFLRSTEDGKASVFDSLPWHWYSSSESCDIIPFQV